MDIDFSVLKNTYIYSWRMKIFQILSMFAAVQQSNPTVSKYTLQTAAATQLAPVSATKPQLTNNRSVNCLISVLLQTQL